MKRKINFNAGPAMLPAEVLAQAREAITEYQGAGMSVLELPHRSMEVAAMIAECNALAKELCALDDDYEVMWMQGGGRMQFCMVPMNFLADNDTAGFIDSGFWAEEAFSYATYYGQVDLLATSKAINYCRLPEWPKEVSDQLSYLHFTTNNTIFGTQWPDIPECNVPLIADMSSDIFSRRRNYSRCAMFYAVAQKNLGIPGATMVAIRKDMLERIVRPLPPMLNYKEHAKEKSVLNTANVFSIYVSLLMLRWIKAKGIDAIEKENADKAKLLYKAIDNSDYFKPHVKHKADRSLMNVCFTANTPEIEKNFLKLCDENNITGINGHRSVGGFRASLYNAVSLADVKELVRVMDAL